jgi:hypothetical protein
LKLRIIVAKRRNDRDVREFLGDEFESFSRCRLYNVIIVIWSEVCWKPMREEVSCDEDDVRTRIHFKGLIDHHLNQLFRRVAFKPSVIKVTDLRI